jgi:hypothetical protein
MSKVLNVDINYFANMRAVEEKPIHIDDPNTLNIPIKHLNASNHAYTKYINEKLITTDVSDLLLIEITEDIDEPTLLKDDYLLVCPIGKHTPKHGDFIIIIDSSYKACRVWIYNNEPFITDCNEKGIQKLSDIKASSVYIVLLFMRRARRHDISNKIKPFNLKKQIT